MKPQKQGEEDNKMTLRGNKGSNNRYTVEEKLNALKMLDKGLSQVDIEIAKGIPTRTLSRWKVERKKLQAKFDARNHVEKRDNNKDVTNTNSDLIQMNNDDKKDVIPDSNNDKVDIKPDTKIKPATNIKPDTTNNQDEIDEAYIAGGNDKVEEISEQVEQAYKDYYKDFVEKTEVKQALNEAKNAVARVKVDEDPAPPSTTPEMPLPEPPEETIIAGLTKWDLGALAGLGGLAGLAYLATKNNDAGKSDDTNW